jgi:outer membrane protein TolC
MAFQKTFRMIVRRERNAAMLKRIVCLSLFILSTLASSTYATVKVRDAVAKALGMSRDVLDRRVDADVSALRKKEIEARRAFTLDFGGTLADASDSPHLRVADISGLSDALAVDVPPEHNLFTLPRVMYDIRLSLSQPIFTGGALNLAAQAEDMAGLAEGEMIRVLEAKVAGEVKGALLRYRILQDVKRSAELFGQSLEHRRQKFEGLFGADLIRKTDVLETRSKIEEVKLSILDLDQMIEEAGLRFRGLCGFAPEEVEMDAEEGIPDLEAALMMVRTNHPLLRYFERKIDQAEAMRKLAARAGKPQVAAFAQLHFGRPGIDFFATTPGFFVLGGLNIGLPILDAKKRETETALAEAETHKLENRRSEIVRETEQEIRRLYTLKSSLEAKHATIARMVEIAEEDVRLKTRQYEEGQIPNLDCLAAMDQLEKSRTMQQEIGIEIEAVKVQIHTFIDAGKERS